MASGRGNHAVSRSGVSPTRKFLNTIWKSAEGEAQEPAGQSASCARRRAELLQPSEPTRADPSLPAGTGGKTPSGCGITRPASALPRDRLRITPTARSKEDIHRFPIPPLWQRLYFVPSTQRGPDSKGAHLHVEELPGSDVCVRPKHCGKEKTFSPGHQQIFTTGQQDGKEKAFPEAGGRAETPPERYGGTGSAEREPKDDDSQLLPPSFLQIQARWDAGRTPQRWKNELHAGYGEHRYLGTGTSGCPRSAAARA